MTRLNMSNKLELDLQCSVDKLGLESLKLRCTSGWLMISHIRSYFCHYAG